MSSSVKKIFQLWRDGDITTGTAFTQARHQLNIDQYAFKQYNHTAFKQNIDQYNLLLEKICSTITEGYELEQE